MGDKKKEKSEIALRLCTSDTEWLLVQSTETGKIEKSRFLGVDKWEIKKFILNMSLLLTAFYTSLSHFESRICQLY